MCTVILRDFATCTPGEQRRLLDIRNQAFVRKAMYTGHEIVLEEHSLWISNLKKSNEQFVFAVLFDNQVSGAIGMKKLDRLHKRCDWFFYLSEDVRGRLAAVLEYAFISYIFDTLAFEKLNCEVLETSPAVLKLHKRFAFQEEGFRRSEIEKDGKRIGVHFLGLTRKDWQGNRQKIHGRYQSVLEQFTVEIETPRDLRASEA